jgi:sigma-B regulation protein RsbU (phosphoserine phosphatase)
MESPMFATAVYMVVDTGRRRVCYTSAGHPKPVRLGKATGLVEPLHFEGTSIGPVLGLFKGAIYSSSTIDLAPGDAMIAYTDGLSEVTSRSGEEFGEQRLAHAIRFSVNQPLEKIFNEVVAAAKKFSANGGFEDDVCLVGFEMGAATGPGQPGS